MNNNYLVFTDLDGTLLNHKDYSFSPAKEALEILREKSIPLILTTSKTFSEVVELQEELGIKEPFIVENGAGIYIPASSVLVDESLKHSEWIKISTANSYEALRLFFKQMEKEYVMEGFGDMDVARVMELTGLEKEQAIRAMKRDFTEPFLLEDESNIPALQEKADAQGFDIVKGGRFFHLVSQNQDKGSAMLRLKKMYDEYYKVEHTTIALGDSANDFTMLNMADKGVLIPLYDGSYSALNNNSVYKASFPGPEGWNDSMKGILNAG